MEKTKEVLHTQGARGEFVIERRNGKIFIEEYFKPNFYPDQDESTQVEVCCLHGNEKVDEDDAAYIIAALNSYQSLIEENKRLKDSNRELVEENIKLRGHRQKLLELLEICDYVNNIINSRGRIGITQGSDTHNNFQTAINNAKNLLP